LHGGKGNSYGKRGEFLHAFFGIARETRVIEFEGFHSGNVWYLVGDVNS
jgi:hypothetical protein